MLADNLAQAPANAIAHNCAPDGAWRDKTGAKTNRIIRGKNAEEEQLATVDATVLLDLLELCRPRQSTTFRKSEGFSRHTCS
jgi:hypothetical protein